MAGTKGMPSGNPWQTHVNPPAPLGAFIDYLVTQKKQGRATWMLHDILINHEKEAREYLGNELYEQYLMKYSKTIIQQMKEREEEQQKEEAQAESKEKETEIKTQFLEAETARMNDKHEDRTEEKTTEKLNNPEYKKLLEEKATWEYCIRKSEEREKANSEHPEYAKGEQQLQAENKAKLAETEKKIKEFLEGKPTTNNA